MFEKFIETRSVSTLEWTIMVWVYNHYKGKEQIRSYNLVYRRDDELFRVIFLKVIMSTCTEVFKITTKKSRLYRLWQIEIV